MSRGTLATSALTWSLRLCRTCDYADPPGFTVGGEQDGSSSRIELGVDRSVPPVFPKHQGLRGDADPRVELDLTVRPRSYIARAGDKGEI